MNRSLILCSVLLLTATKLAAQFTELWRSEILKQPSGSFWQNIYGATAAVVDNGGNTLVGGVFDSPGTFPQADTFIAKLDAQGRKQWCYHFESVDQFARVEAIAVDQLGNTFFTTRLAATGWYHFFLLSKLDPDGKILWSFQEKCFLIPYPDSASGVAVDSEGNAIILELGLLPDRSGPELWITKFDPNGNQLWRTFLPGNDYQTSEGRISRSLALLQDGSAVVAGIKNYAGFIAKIEPKGKLVWFVEPQQLNPGFTDYFFDIVVNKKDRICARGFYSYAILKSNGKLESLLNTQNWLDGLATTPEDDFLVGVSMFEYSWIDVRENGREAWRAPTELYDLLGAVPDGKRGWNAVGLTSFYPMSPPLGFTFDHYNSKGIRTVREIIPLAQGEFWQNHLYRNFDALLPAPDGSMRLIVTRTAPSLSAGDHDSILVLAFTFEDK